MIHTSTVYHKSRARSSFFCKNFYQKYEAGALPLPEMYGKNLTFETYSLDGCDCVEILRLIEAGKIDTKVLITHHYELADIGEAYRLFEKKLDGVIKVAVTP